MFATRCSVFRQVGRHILTTCVSISGGSNSSRLQVSTSRIHPEMPANRHYDTRLLAPMSPQGLKPKARTRPHSANEGHASVEKGLTIQYTRGTTIHQSWPESSSSSQGTSAIPTAYSPRPASGSPSLSTPPSSFSFSELQLACFSG